MRSPRWRSSSLGSRQLVRLDLDHAAVAGQYRAALQEDRDDGRWDRREHRYRGISPARGSPASGARPKPPGGGLRGEVAVEGEQVEQGLPHRRDPRPGQVANAPDLEPTTGEEQGGGAWGRLDPVTAWAQRRPVLGSEPGLQARRVCGVERDSAIPPPSSG